LKIAKPQVRSVGFFPLIGGAAKRLSLSAVLAYYVVPLLAPSDSNYVRSNSEQLFCVTMRDQRTVGG
jgi:hypothetical protein